MTNIFIIAEIIWLVIMRDKKVDNKIVSCNILKIKVDKKSGNLEFGVKYINMGNGYYYYDNQLLTRDALLKLVTIRMNRILVIIRLKSFVFFLRGRDHSRDNFIKKVKRLVVEYILYFFMLYEDSELVWMGPIAKSPDDFEVIITYIKEFIRYYSLKFRKVYFYIRRFLKFWWWWFVHNLYWWLYLGVVKWVNVTVTELNKAEVNVKYFDFNLVEVLGFTNEDLFVYYNRLLGDSSNTKDWISY